MATEFNFPWLNLKTISDLRMTLSGTWLDFITTSPRRRKASGQYNVSNNLCKNFVQYDLMHTIILQK